MKKIHLLHYLLLCYMVLAVATSCGDDEDDYAPDNVNDPEKLTDPLPTTDQLGVTHNNTLYYLSFWSKEDHMISENMINRYKEAVPYAPGKKMEVGDAFFFTRQDIDRIQSDTDLLADIKDMFHKRSIVMMMEGGTNEDFNTVCTLLDCYNPYAKEDESYSDELPLWVFSGPLPSASGFYSKLNALSTATGADGKESVQTINEYGQGFHCDMTSQSLQRALEPKAPSNGSSDLKNLISAYIVIGQNSYTAPPVHGHEGKGTTDNFQVEAKIWTAYSRARYCCSPRSISPAITVLINAIAARYLIISAFSLPNCRNSCTSASIILAPRSARKIAVTTFFNVAIRRFPRASLKIIP